MTTADIIRRKAAIPRPQASEGMTGAGRAFRMGLGKAARDVLNLQLEVEKLSIDQRTASELVEVVPDFALIAVLDGPSPEMGVMILSQAIVAGVIEAQTIGRVRGQGLAPRKPTRTDGAMVTGLMDGVLAILEQSLGDTTLGNWTAGYRCASFLPDPRPLPVVLEDVPLQLFTADVTLAGGLRKGQIFLALPSEMHLPPPKAEDQDTNDEERHAFGQALQNRVEGASVKLNAILARVSLPMVDVLRMAEGMILPLQDAVLDLVSLEGADGRGLATGKLGQNRGMRALRLLDTQPAMPRQMIHLGRLLSGPTETNRAHSGGGADHPVLGAERRDTPLVQPTMPFGDILAQEQAGSQEAADLYDLRGTGTH